MNKIVFTFIGVLLVTLAVLTGIIFVKLQTPLPQLGSVIQGSEYQSTSTYNGIGQIVVLSTTTGDIYATKAGVFGSVVITTPGAAIEVYDTTTTNKNLRAPELTTNTIRRASFPAELAAGTYTFDSIYKHGLIVVFGSSDIPTSTVTFR